MYTFSVGGDVVKGPVSCCVCAVQQPADQRAQATGSHAHCTWVEKLRLRNQGAVGPDLQHQHQRSDWIWPSRHHFARYVPLSGQADVSITLSLFLPSVWRTFTVLNTNMVVIWLEKRQWVSCKIAEFFPNSLASQWHDHEIIESLKNIIDTVYPLPPHHQITLWSCSSLSDVSDFKRKTELWYPCRSRNKWLCVKSACWDVLSPGADVGMCAQEVWSMFSLAENDVPCPSVMYGCV